MYERPAELMVTAMRALLLTVGVLLTVSLLGQPSSASASWSPPWLFAAPTAAAPSVAVDARGDSVAAWETRTLSPRGHVLPRTSVLLVERLADGRALRRVVWSSPTLAPGSVSVALGHGEITLVWTVVPRKPPVLQGGFSAETLFASQGPLLGHWRRPQTLGRSTASSYPPAGFTPHLAVAPNGWVLLAWDDYSRPIHGPAVAWRAPGHDFRTPLKLANASLAPNGLGPIPAFDAAGAAYVWGPCNGFVWSAPSHHRRFGTPVLVAPGRAQPPWMRHSSLGLNLSLAGPGSGLASWIQGDCSFDAATGNTPGPVFASVLRAGKFSAPLLLAVGELGASTAVATAEGGIVSFMSMSGFGAPSPPQSVQIGPGESIAAIPQATTPSIPVARDGADDQLLAQLSPIFPRGTPQPLWAWPGAWPGTQLVGNVPLVSATEGSQSLVVRQPNDGAEEPAPVQNGWLATSTPLGRSFAIWWRPDASRTLAVSVWRP